MNGSRLDLRLSDLSILAGAFRADLSARAVATEVMTMAASTTPTAGRWRRQPPSELQRALDAMPKAPLIEVANGPATIETYTVMYGKADPDFGIVIGRLEPTGEHFLSNTPKDLAVLRDLQAREGLGRHGIVRHEDGRNVFAPA